MSRKHKEFADWYNEPIEGLISVRSDYLMGLESDYRAAWDAARMIDDEPDPMVLLAALEAIADLNPASPGAVNKMQEIACEVLAKYRKAGE